MRKHVAGAREVGRSVDAERRVVDSRAGDPHTGLQRPELLQFLPPLQRRFRQCDEPGERRAAIGVDADMVPARPLAGRRSAAREK